jgi:hypothetical protein
MKAMLNPFFNNIKGIVHFEFTLQSQIVNQAYYYVKTMVMQNGA